MTNTERLQSDIRQLRKITTLERNNKFREFVGCDRYQAAMDYLAATDPVEAATIEILYVPSWDWFEEVCDTHKVSAEHNVDKEEDENLNKRFRDRIIEKGLGQMVRTLFQQQEAA